MTDRPILFSGSMVCALLAGTKTQTRRVVKPPPMVGPEESWFVRDCGQWAWGPRRLPTELPGRLMSGWRTCPYGAPGDRLWVRETWADGSKVYPCHQFEYRATAMISDDDVKEHGRGCTFAKDGKKNFECYKCAGFKWKPSIHMPRAGSRITLVVTDVRVQRAQDISEEDARDEGCPGESEESAADEYAHLWNTINGPGAWDLNPWVWAITFRRVTP